jgi:predicted MPP superfamily phosphohydrolase
MAREGVRRLIVFFTIVLSVWIVLNVYVFWRAASVPVVERHVPRWALVLVAVVLASSYVLARILDRRGASAVVWPLEFLGANWMGVLFLSFAALLLVDVVTGFGILFRERAPSLRGWALLSAVALSVVALAQGARAPLIRNYEVRLEDLPAERDGTVVVVVSDLHLGTLIGKRWLKARIGEIEALKPDLIVLCGDILEGDSNQERDLVPLLGRLTAPMGVYAVTGNHEFYAGIEKSVKDLTRPGVHVLRDRWEEVRPGLIFAGVDDLTARRQYLKNGDPVARALAGRPKGATVLLSHSPWKADEAARLGAGLMLSGHTHAGQIWPFGYVTGVRYPLLQGRYEIGGMTVIVCRGTGTWGPRMRLWRRSEIVRITLREG